MPLLRDLPSGGGGTSVEGVGARQLDSHVGFVPRLTVRLLVSLMSMSVGGSLLWVPASGGVKATPQSRVPRDSSPCTGEPKCGAQILGTATGSAPYEENRECLQKGCGNLAE